MNPITMKIPYMTNPGNHEVACTEGDTADHSLSDYLNNDVVNGTGSNGTLTYYSCPASQR